MELILGKPFKLLECWILVILLLLLLLFVFPRAMYSYAFETFNMFLACCGYIDFAVENSTVISTSFF